MSLWVKICGNTSMEDSLLAAETGADALGFIFAPSPRRVTPDQVEAITALLPAAVEKIGVFVDATFDEIVSTVRVCRLTGVQLHAETSPELPAQLRAQFGPDLRILRVVHFGPEAARQAQNYAADPNIDAILVDSRSATAVGGTGIAFDWEQARATVFGGTRATQLIAAGGLNPGNVAEAIATLCPWGIDAVSGVEASPGRKDPAKVRAFIHAARSIATPH